MAVYLELISAPVSRFLPPTDSTGRRRAGASTARRPTRGLEIKEDTYAMMRVIMPDGSFVSLLNPNEGTTSSDMTTNFLLQSVSEARMEKHQIIETFGDAYVFFFGEHPRFIDYSAILLNSNDFNWEAEFDHNYENYFRGTKLVEMGARLYLYYDDTIVEGYMVSSQKTKSSEGPLSVGLNFRLFVVQTYNVSQAGSPLFPISSTALESFGEEADALLKPDETMRYSDDETFYKLIQSLYDPNITDFSSPLTWIKPKKGLRSLIKDNTDEYVSPWEGEVRTLYKSGPYETDDDIRHMPADYTDVPPEDVPGVVDKLGVKNDEPSFWDKLGNCFSCGSLPGGNGGFASFNTSSLGFPTTPGGMNGPSLSPTEFWGKLKSGYKDAEKAAKKAAGYINDPGSLADDALDRAKDAIKNAPITVNGKRTTLGKSFDDVKKTFNDVRKVIEDPSSLPGRVGQFISDHTSVQVNASVSVNRTRVLGARIQTNTELRARPRFCIISVEEKIL